MTTDTPAARLAGGAWAYLRAAELLHQDDPRDLAWAACYVNIAFAIELGLKSFIRANGASELEQKRLGHNLHEAYGVALRLGFKSSHHGGQAIAEGLSPMHIDMSLRYLLGDVVILPTVSEVIPVIKVMLFDLHEQGVGAPS